MFLFLVCISIYSINSIQKNIKKMADAAHETVNYYPAYPAVNVKNNNADLIKRGEYLAKMGDCLACHTNTAEKEKAAPFAGGLAMHTPFGTIYAPNITPDKETGIGKWTEEQFIKAMQKGISPEGHYYYPAFPYIYFNKIPVEEIKAIKAYLDSIPAVYQKNRENEMMWPFNWRFMQLGWRLLFFKSEGEFRNNPERSPYWNRGASIAEGLGHCAMCHSPSYHILDENVSLGAPIRKYDLTGAKVQGFLAPNITSSNLSKVPLEEIIDVFTQDKMIGGGKVEGPMLEVNHNSLHYLSHEDLVSLATYLKEVESETPPKPTGSAVGKGIYDIYCSGCHASGAGGAPKYGDKAAWESLLKEGVDKIYTNAIQGKGSMPAKGTCLSCSDDEIKKSVDYMLDSIKGGGERGPILNPRPKPLTIEDGKRIYEAKCSACHDGSYKEAPKLGDIPSWQKYVDAGFLKTYLNVITGKSGHPIHGACTTCTDAEIKAAVKYMMQESSVGKDYHLW